MMQVGRAPRQSMVAVFGPADASKRRYLIVALGILCIVGIVSRISSKTQYSISLGIK